MESKMANITRYDPFGDLDDFFKGFFVRPVAFEGEKPMQIKLDVKENDNAYTVHADIPGVKKEDIHVTVEGNMVSISAEKKTEKEEKEGDKVLRSERFVGKVSRSFSLGSDVDESKAQARYNDGVLELTLPKKAGSGSKKVAIQ
jgi:HSP20 family protein